MFKALQKPRVVYLGLSLELYLTSMPSYMERWGKVFDCWRQQLSQLAEIVYSRTCYTESDMAEAVAGFANLAPDAIVMSPLSYTASLTSVPFIQDCGIPIILWSTQFADRIKEDYRPEDLSMNHTVQGTQDITNVLFQRGVDFAVVTGHYQDEVSNARLADCLIAARAARLARKIRTVSLGGMFKGMGDFEFDAAQATRQWGPEFFSATIDEFREEFMSADDRELEELRQQDLKSYEIAPELSQETHLNSLRGYLALRGLLKKYQADALTMNFLNLMKEPKCPVLPFFGINRLMAEGMGYAGEGDALRAALMAHLRQLAGMANFTEIYTVDFKRDIMLMSHMQECNPAFARRDRKIKLLHKKFRAPGVAPYCGMYFTLEPGETTLVTLTCDGKGGFRYIAFAGIIEDAELFPNYDRPYWLLRSQNNVSELLDRYSLTGGTHHLIALPGNQLAKLKQLAYWQKFEFYDITE